MNLVVDNQTTHWALHVKCLGVTLNHNLNINSHVKNIIQKTRRARGALYPLLNRNSPLPMTIHLTIFNIYLKPIILYTSPVWRNLIGSQSWKNIEAFQNISLRTITICHYLVSSLSIKNSTNLPSLKDETLH